MKMLESDRFEVRKTLPYIVVGNAKKVNDPWAELII